MNNIYELYITLEEYVKAEKNGIDKNTLYKRIREYGWDKQRALSQPKRVRPNLSKWKAIAVKNGISAATFRRRVREGWSIEDACTVKTMTKSEVTKIMRSKRQHIFSVWRKAKFYID